MADQEYNGWPNYETWCVNLWMDNEQGSQEFFRETAKEIYDETDSYNTGLNKQEYARCRFADWLKHYHTEENRPVMPTCGLYYDLLSAALAAVNWDSIARQWIDAVEEDSNA